LASIRTACPAADGIGPATGEVTSRLHLAARMTQTGMPQAGAIVATSPLTLYVSDDGTDENASFVVLNPAGTQVARVIPAGAQGLDAAPGSHVLFATPISGDVEPHPAVNAFVSGDTLIAVSYRIGWRQGADSALRHISYGSCRSLP
jgi:hypothetical protein